MGEKTIETLKLEAIDLTNLYIKHGGNQAGMAEAQGVTRQAMNQRLKNNPFVLEFMQDRARAIEAIAAEKGIDTNSVLDILNSATRAKVTDDDGLADWNTRLKALNLLAKILRMVENTSQNTNIQVNIENISLSERIRALEKEQVGSEAIEIEGYSVDQQTIDDAIRDMNGDNKEGAQDE